MAANARPRGVCALCQKAHPVDAEGMKSCTRVGQFKPVIVHSDPTLRPYQRDAPSRVEAIEAKIAERAAREEARKAGKPFVRQPRCLNCDLGLPILDGGKHDKNGIIVRCALVTYTEREAVADGMRAEAHRVVSMAPALVEGIAKKVDAEVMADLKASLASSWKPPLPPPKEFLEGRQTDRALAAVRAGASTSTEVAQATGLKQGNASSALSSLRQEGRVRLVGNAKSHGGRCLKRYEATKVTDDLGPCPKCGGDRTKPYELAMCVACANDGTRGTAAIRARASGVVTEMKQDEDRVILAEPEAVFPAGRTDAKAREVAAVLLPQIEGVFQKADLVTRNRPWAYKDTDKVVEVEGRVTLHTPVEVTAKEMGTWSPERITAFFDGIAKTINAAASVPVRDLKQVAAMMATDVVAALPAPTKPDPDPEPPLGIEMTAEEWAKRRQAFSARRYKAHAGGSVFSKKEFSQIVLNAVTAAGPPGIPEETLASIVNALAEMAWMATMVELVIRHEADVLWDEKGKTVTFRHPKYRK